MDPTQNGAGGRAVLASVVARGLQCVNESDRRTCIHILSLSPSTESFLSRLLRGLYALQCFFALLEEQSTPIKLLSCFLLVLEFQHVS